jgi:hypothetical protein
MASQTGKNTFLSFNPSTIHSIYHPTNTNPFSFSLKGEEVQTGRVLDLDVYQLVQVGFFDGGSREFESELHYCEDDVPPDTISESIKPLCILKTRIPCCELYCESSFKSPFMKGKFRRANYRIEVLLGNANLAYRMRYREMEVGSVVAEYKENF